jgi:hypothetical protein
MPEVGFEHTITASERTKTVHASNHSATVTGINACDTAKFTFFEMYISLRYWVFGLCPSSGFFLNNNEKHNEGAPSKGPN